MTEPFVYLPGLDGSAELLFMQEEELGRRFDIVRVPWRSEQPFGHDDLVRDVLRALDERSIDRATIFAESFGGTVGLLLALDHPERVERLVLCNAFAHYPNRPLIRWGRAIARAAHPTVVHAIRQLVDHPLLAMEGVRADARRRFIDATYRQPLPAYARRLELIECFDVRERLREIAVETLVITSENDRVVPCEASHALASAIPGASLRVLPRQGHAVLLTPDVSLLRLMDDARHGVASRA